MTRFKLKGTITKSHRNIYKVIVISNLKWIPTGYGPPQYTYTYFLNPTVK